MSLPTVSATQTFMLPDLGEGLTEAEVIEWHVAPGDLVQVDQVVVTVETAKASVDVPSPYAGLVLTLHGAPGAILEVGKPLLSVGADQPAAQQSETERSETGRSETGRSETGHSAADPGKGSEKKADLSTSSGATAVPAEKSGSGNVLVGYGTSDARRSGRRRVGPAGRRTPTSTSTNPVTAADGAGQPATASVVAPKVISPVVRKLARDNGIDCAALTPTGPGDVIRRADVESALLVGRPPGTQTGQASPERTTAQGPVPADRAGDLRIPLRGVRRAIAEKMTISRREIPEASVWVDVDATGLLAAKDEIRSAAPAAGVGLLALFARITVAGLTRFPELNARVDLDAQEIVQLHDINLSFAAQSPRGLVVPVVHGAGQMTTAELAGALRELTALARDGKLSPAQMTGGTFTLNNYGVFGTDGATPIINYPEAAMLGVGRIIDRPWAHDGQVALRKVAQLGLTFDHRVCDGGTAGGFLRFVADCVEKPARLLAEL